MNPDRVQAVLAVVISILVHAGFAMLGDFQPGAEKAAPGSLAVTVAGYTNSAEYQSSQDQQPQPDTKPPSIPHSEPEAETSADKIPSPEIVVSEVSEDSKQVVQSVMTPRRKEPAEEPVRKADQVSEIPPSPVSAEEKSTAVASQSETDTLTASANSSAATSQPKASEINLDSINQSSLPGEAMSRGVLAKVKPDVSAIPLYHLIPKPPYPSRARDLGESGTVIVAILVAADGSVADAYVSQSSGYPLLDGSALTTVKTKWRFKPATRNGKSVDSWVRVPINFNIK